MYQTDELIDESIARLDDKWIELLGKIVSDEFILMIKQLYREKQVCPYPQYLFGMFYDIYPEEVKVVILGQDPYPKCEGIGYAFAYRDDIKPPKSFNRLLKSFEKVGIYLQGDNTMKQLRRRGILMLNTAWTVEYGKPLSHNELWKIPIRYFLKRLNSFNNQIKYVALGSRAAGVLKDLDIDFIKCLHPAARVAKYFCDFSSV